MKINPQLLVPGVLLALSLPLAAVKNPTASLLGMLGTTAAGGYGVASFLQREEIARTRSELTRQQRQLESDKAAHQNRTKGYRAEMQAKLDAAIAERDRIAADCKAKLDASESQRRQLLDDAKALMSEEIRREIEGQYQAQFEQKTADFTRREDEFYHAEGELCDQIELLQELLTKNENYLREEFSKETGSKVEQWTGRYKKLQGQIAEYGQVIQSVGSEAMEEIKQKDLVIARLKGQVDLLGAPKKYRGNSQDDAIANKVLEFFLARGVAVEAEDWQRSYHQLKVLLFPKGAKLAELQALADDLQVALGLYARPVISIEGSLFAIECDTDAKVAEKATINEPPLSRLEKAISDAIQVRIAAPSGSGKSVLLGNITNYLTQTYLSSYELYDPKVTAREVWGNLTPTYYSTDCIPALFSLAETCLERINLCKTAAEIGTAAPKFDPEFHIIDELEFMYGLVDILDNKNYTSKKFAINVKTGLKVGREHKIKLLFVTQSALCSDINLKKNDFFNTTSLFLGQTIFEALDSDLMSAVPASKKAALRGEYKARLARGDKYTILVYEPEKPTEAWLCSAPSPGHYAALAGESAQKNDQNENLQNEGVAASPVPPSENPATLAGQAAQSSTENPGKPDSRAELGNGTESAQGSTELAVLLAQGTHCPNCGTHSASFKNKQPTKKGEVTVRCKTKGCASGGTFKWKVVDV